MDQFQIIGTPVRIETADNDIEALALAPLFGTGFAASLVEVLSESSGGLSDLARIDVQLSDRGAILHDAEYEMDTFDTRLVDVTPSVTYTRDGGFVAGWLDKDGGDVAARSLIYDAEFAAGDVFGWSGSDDTDEANLQLVTLGNGNIAATWTNELRDVNNWRVYYESWSAIRDATGESVIEPVRIADDTRMVALASTALPDGGYASLFKVNGPYVDGEQAPDYVSGVQIRRFDAEGRAVGAPVDVPLETPDIVDFGDIVALRDGSVVVAVPGYEPGETAPVLGFIFGPGGAQRGPMMSLNHPDAPLWSETDTISLTALDGGGFAVAYVSWEEYLDETTLTERTRIDPMVRSFDDDGTPRGPWQLIPGVTHVGERYTQELDELSIDMVQLANGDLALGWVAEAVGLGATPGHDVQNAYVQMLRLPAPPRAVDGTDGDDLLTGGAGADTLRGFGGNDTLRGMDGADVLNGGDGDDVIIGGASDADLRDVVYAGAGNDSIDGGYGNDQIFGQGGNDTIAGGFGADNLQGQDGDDVITGSAFGDIVFGNAGDDFVNGGFGHDLINGGTGADKFFHTGGTREQMEGHGSDWVQDYSAAEGDVLVFGGSGNAGQFQVNTTHTANKETGERSGDDSVEEAFVIYKPTGQILWALVDGAGQSEINLQIGAEVFDLLA